MNLETIFEKMPSEVLQDDYWGDMLEVVGSFIVTSKGIFTDRFLTLGEVFLSYTNDQPNVEKVVRLIDYKTEDDGTVIIDPETGRQETEYYCTKVCSLFDGKMNVNNNMTLLMSGQFKGVEKLDFYRAFDKAKEYLKSKGITDVTKHDKEG